MSGPTRLRNGSDPALRELMQYAQDHDRPSAEHIDMLTSRVLGELAKPPSTASSLASWPILGWPIGLAALMLGLGSSWLIARQQPAHDESPAPFATSVQTPAALAPNADPAAVQPATSIPVAEDADSARAQPRRIAKPIRTPLRNDAKSASSPKIDNRDAEVEVRLLKRARESLATDPAAALALLADHVKQFPDGVFIEEREALTIEASWRMGRDDRAAQDMRAFCQRYPRSAYRERLQALLASDAPLRRATSTP